MNGFLKLSDLLKQHFFDHRLIKLSKPFECHESLIYKMLQLRLHHLSEQKEIVISSPDNHSQNIASSDIGRRKPIVDQHKRCSQMISKNSEFSLVVGILEFGCLF